jgi:hypothetical protein
MRRTLFGILLLWGVSHAQIEHRSIDTLRIAEAVDLDSGTVTPIPSYYNPAGNEEPPATSLDLALSGYGEPRCMCDAMAIQTFSQTYQLKIPLEQLDRRLPLNPADTTLFKPLASLHASSIINLERDVKIGESPSYLLRTRQGNFVLLKFVRLHAIRTETCSGVIPCNHGLAIKWWVQRNGSLDFSDAMGSRRTALVAPAAQRSATMPSPCWYDLKGRQHSGALPSRFGAYLSVQPNNQTKVHLGQHTPR